MSILITNPATGGGGSSSAQHVVEFIPGTGVVLDGVVIDADTSSPWDWVVPADVSQLILNGISGGCGGGCGARTSDDADQQGGGGGGTSGVGLLGAVVPVRPGSTLTIACGSGGVGGSQAGTRFGLGGGETTITGLLIGPGTTTSVFRLGNGDAFGGAESSSSSGSPGRGFAGPASNGTGGAVGANGGNGQFNPVAALGISGGTGWVCPAGGGGGANASGSVAGGLGGRASLGSDSMTVWLPSAVITSAIAAAGNTTGTVSRGGGGQGGHSPWGAGGVGGAGGADGTSGSGYGAGGGGGGGGHTGSAGSGSPGYVSLSYTSAI